MNYQVFARKWRPRKFSDVIGQQHVIEVFMQSFRLNKIHHAYMLSGTRGVGKTTIARLFAKGLNCNKGPTFDICNQCKNCQDVEHGAFVDLIEIDAASRTKVEDTREFLDGVQYTPARGKFKIYLIDEIHMLSRHSFNALLKVLEEPPNHVKFILITTEYRKLPKTILSRCLQFYLKPLSISQIVTKLTYICNIENITSNTHALEILAYSAKGSMRDALNLLEQAVLLSDNNVTVNIVENMFGASNIEYSLSLIENLVDGNLDNIMCQIDNYSDLGVNWDHLFNEILIIFQKMAINQFLSCSLQKKKDNNCVKNFEKRMYILSNNIEPENIQLYYQIFLLGRKELPYAPSYRMGIEMTILRALAFSPNKSDLENNQNTQKKKMLNKRFCENSVTNIKDNKNIYNINSMMYSQLKLIHNDYFNNQDTIIKIKSKCSTNHKVYKNSKKLTDNIDNIDLNSEKLKKFISNGIVSNTTAVILQARTKIMNYKKLIQSYPIDTQFNVNINFQNMINNSLIQFFKSNNNFLENSDNHCIEEDKYLIKKVQNKKLDSMKDSNVNLDDIPKFIKKILLLATTNDPWISKIYQMSLTKEVKMFLMNSWKESISPNEVSLFLRSYTKPFYSTKLHNVIQAELSKDTGVSVKLNVIICDDNTLKKTPMEYILFLYTQEKLQLKKKILMNPCVKIIQMLFDADFDITHIEFL